MKRIKRLACTVLALMLLLSGLVFPASASSATMSLSPNKGSYAVGDTVTVTVRFSGSNLYAIDGTLSFDNSLMQFVSGTGSCSGNTVKIVETLSGENSAAYSVTFKATAPGNNYFKFVAEGSDGTTKQPGSAGVTVKIAAPAEPIPSSAPETPSSVPVTSSEVSDNANLSSLRVSGGALSPAFSASVTEYNVTLTNTIEKCTVSASPADGAAKVAGTGTYDLKVGNNRKSVTVTAANGATKTYNINIRRQEEGENAEVPPENSTAVDGDPLAITVDGEAYRFMTDISALTVPDGYTVENVDRGGVAVPMLRDKGSTVTLCYLANEEKPNGELFSYTADGTAEKLLYLYWQNRLYIVMKAEEGLVAPKGYYNGTLPVKGGTASVYCSEDERLSDFCILYCKVDGQCGFYRYDRAEEILQRAPDFELAAVQSTDNASGKRTIFDLFRETTGIGKAILLLFAAAALCILALIVLLIVKIAMGRKAATPPVFMGSKGDTMFEEEDLYNTTFDFGDNGDKKEE